MSVKAMSWAFEQPVSGNDKCVLLALADECRGDDGLCWPGQARIARKAFVSEKTVSRVMARLEERGYLRRERRARENGSRTSDLTYLNLSGEGLTDKVSGDDSRLPNQTRVSPPEPGVEPEALLPAVGENARGKPKRPRYRGKLVPDGVVADALTLLGKFNESFGRDLGAWKADGSPSSALTQIIGAMLSRDDVAPGAWERAVRNTAANPPGWLDDRPAQIGDVFGARSADHALANDGCLRSRRAGRDNAPTAADFARLALEPDDSP